MEHRRLAPLVLKTLALLIAAVALGAASQQRQHEDIPVFVIGSDGGLSPFVMRRDSEEFREFVFTRLAEALALEGFRAIDEAPFRARYPVDGDASQGLDRWASYDFLYYANSLTVDEAGNKAPYMVLVDVWERRCRDDNTYVCIEIGVAIHETASGEGIAAGGLGRAFRVHIPPPCDESCRWRFWEARSDGLFHPLGAEIASRISEHLSAGAAPAGR